jgi:hypothetical protein
MKKAGHWCHQTSGRRISYDDRVGAEEAPKEWEGKSAWRWRINQGAGCWSQFVIAAPEMIEALIRSAVPKSWYKFSPHLIGGYGICGMTLRQAVPPISAL